MEPAPLVTTRGLTFTRVFTPEDTDPLDTVVWATRDAVIVGADGQEIFRQNGVEVPEFWSDTTVNIVAEMYFRVVNGVKESSARQMFLRVADWIENQAIEQNIFDCQQSAENFRADLLFMLVQGLFAFNSPVWFNVGVIDHPQCSACFIQSVQDNMGDIMGLQQSEVMLFRGGSGTGSDLSPLRSSYETLSKGGHASGPVSFMKGFDQWAGVTKSGGTTRRAAKLNKLRIDHPDVLELRTGEPGFIRCKADAEKQAHVLYRSGEYSAEWNKPGNVYDRVSFQNANNSVGISHAFMKAVEADGEWQTIAVLKGAPVHTYKARDLFNEISKAAHFCGDPGVQFDDTINQWNTCRESDIIRATNPCAEYIFLNDSACNLGSLNLLKFAKGQVFDVPSFKHACATAITAMETLVSASSYPTPQIEKNSHLFRPLGLGYTNLGALLTFWGLPYDSHKGRNAAAAITAIMGGAAYAQSARLAQSLGAFSEYNKNKAHMTRVIEAHCEAARTLPAITNENRKPLVEEAYQSWKEASQLGREYGFRNAQVTVLAPTGTISFLLGADTTGIEPMLGCVVYKKVVGQGLLVLPNGIVGPSLINLGYTPEQAAAILEHIAHQGNSIHDAPGFDDREHGPIFSEALGKFAIAPEGHVDMMASVQPFISGGISKTVNMPHDCTPEDIAKIYLKAWRAGLKCIAVFRDKCKLSQPIQTTKTEAAKKTLAWGERKKMPIDADSKRHKFEVGGQEGYVHAGLYPDGTLGEIFLDISKQGSTLNGLLEAFATSVSIGLQHGVPRELYCEKFKDTRFDPAGFGPTFPDPERRSRHYWSVLDYIFRWIEWRFEKQDTTSAAPSGHDQVTAQGNLDGPPCSICGMLTRRSGSCYVCSSCGVTTGCG